LAIVLFIFGTGYRIKRKENNIVPIRIGIYKGDV